MLNIICALYELYEVKITLLKKITSKISKKIRINNLKLDDNIVIFFDVMFTENFLYQKACF